MYDKKVSKFVIIYERGEQNKGKSHSGSKQLPLKGNRRKGAGYREEDYKSSCPTKTNRGPKQAQTIDIYLETGCQAFFVQRGTILYFPENVLLLVKPKMLTFTANIKRCYKSLQRQLIPIFVLLEWIRACCQNKQIFRTRKRTFPVAPVSWCYRVSSI